MIYTDDAPAEMTPKQLRKRNKELAPLGKRICRAHQGAALPLTEEYFYRHPTCLGGLETICKMCRNARVVERARERYRTSKRFRNQRKKAQQLDRERHIEARREANARRMQDYRQRRKRVRFVTVLAQASGG